LVLASGLVFADPGLDRLVRVSPPPRRQLTVPPSVDLAPFGPAPATAGVGVEVDPPVPAPAPPAVGPLPVPTPPADLDLPPLRADRGARVAVWSTWVVTTLTSSTLVLAAGRNIPIQEDWHVVPAAFGRQTGFWGWLWKQNNEHRVPLPKLVYVGLLRIWPDFRVGMLFNLIVLAGVAAACIVAARRLRGGRTRWTDAFFPLVLLHPGHWENFGWGWQLTFVMATALACCLLLAVLPPGGLSRRRAIVLGACVVVIPLTGATALPLVPFVTAAALWVTRRSTPAVARVVRLSAVAGAALVVAYLVGLERPDWVTPSPGPAASILTGAKVLALSLGPAAGAWWLVSIAAVVAVVGGAAVLFHRARAWIPLAFLLGGVVLAGLIGNSRAGLLATFGLPDRYAIVVVPVLVCAYFAYDRYGGGLARRYGPAALCIGMLGLFPLNLLYGMQYRDWYHHRVDTFAADIRAGTPLGQLASYRPIAVDREEMSLSMSLLRQEGIGVFAELGDEDRTAGPRRVVDGLADGPGGWVVSGDPDQVPAASTATFGDSEQGPVVRWNYHVTRTWAALARVFDSPQDWRGTGALEIGYRGQGTGEVVRVRLAMAEGAQADRYDSLFIDDRVGPRTVVLPWNAFGHVDEDNRWDSEGPIPLDHIGAVVFIVGQPGSGELEILRLAVRPGHGQLGWPLHPAADRRSLAPWG
jgi:hypothetical protein